MFSDVLDFLIANWAVTLLALMLAQALGLARMILSERREPAATLAWLMTATFLPLIGILAYYALARTRFRRQFRARTLVNRQADEALSLYVQERSAEFDDSVLQSLPAAQQDLIALGANSARPPTATQPAPDEPVESGGPAFPGNSVTLYTDPAAKLDALADAIRSAKSHVHLEYYIFRGDGAGTRIRDLLIERAAAGVEVRLLLDGIGSFGAYPSAFFRPLLAAGGRVETFLPVKFGKIIERVNFRNHRKIAVIDGSAGFVGGMNIGDELLGGDPAIGAWRDAHVRITGPAVAELQRTFLTDWLFTTDETLADPRFFPAIEPAGDELVQIISSGPDCHWPTIHQLYLQAITSARREILIATPYFVPDPALRSALETAALRGVDLRILLPSKSDARIVTSAARSYYEELLESGIRIFEYHDGFLHAKSLAVDGNYGSVGSANMDIRSFTLNFETSAFIHSRRFASTLRAEFESAVASADEIDLEAFRNRPRVRKFGQSVAQILSGIL